LWWFHDLDCGGDCKTYPWVLSLFDRPLAVQFHSRWNCEPDTWVLTPTSKSNKKGCQMAAFFIWWRRRGSKSVFKLL